VVRYPALILSFSHCAISFSNRLLCQGKLRHSYSASSRRGNAGRRDGWGTWIRTKTGGVRVRTGLLICNLFSPESGEKWSLKINTLGANSRSQNGRLLLKRTPLDFQGGAALQRRIGNSATPPLIASSG